MLMEQFMVGPLHLKSIKEIVLKEKLFQRKKPLLVDLK